MKRQHSNTNAFAACNTTLLRKTCLCDMHAQLKLHVGKVRKQSNSWESLSEDHHFLIVDRKTALQTVPIVHHFVFWVSTSLVLACV